MFTIQKAKEYWRNKPLLFVDFLVKKMNFLFPDKLYLSIRYRLQMGYWMDWENPRTFNEKLQWLKVYGCKPEYTKLVDKLAVKEYVSECIGSEYVIPTLAVYDRVKDIDWNSLPAQFVLKTTHGGGGLGVVICRDKITFDKKTAKRKLQRSMKMDIAREQREKQYLNVPHRILVEQYMEEKIHSGIEELIDYKFYCFGGIPKLVMAANGRQRGNKRFGYYDTNWNPIGITWGAPRPIVEFERPSCLDEMLRIATKLSTNLIHVRIDLYDINDRVYFGEITFFDDSGFGKISPESFDLTMGEWIKLPQKSE